MLCVWGVAVTSEGNWSRRSRMSLSCVDTWAPRLALGRGGVGGAGPDWAGSGGMRDKHTPASCVYHMIIM